MRAISPAIAVILLIVMAVALSAVSYVWLQSVIHGWEEQTERQTQAISNSINNLQITYAYFYENKDGLVLDLRFDEGEGNIAHDYSGNGNDGIVSGSIIGDFEDSIDGFILDCGGSPNYEFVDGYKGRALKIFPTGGDYLACANKNVGSVKKGEVFWFYAKGKNIYAQIWCGHTNSKLYMYERGQWVEVSYHSSNDWHLYKLVVQQDDASGNCGIWLYSRGSGNYGIFDNVRRGAIWIDGIFGKALEFDGVDDYVESTVISPTNYTVVAWFKTHLLPSELGHPIGVVSNRGSHHKPTFIIRAWTNDIVETAYTYNDGDSWLVLNGIKIEKNKWYHIAVTRNNDYLRMYIDGVKVAEKENPPTPDISPDTVKVGWTGYSNRYFNGTIDEVRIYNQALDNDTIKNLFYRIHLIVHNPSTKPIDLNNTNAQYIIEDTETTPTKTVCTIPLIHNKTFITRSGSTIIYPNKDDVIKLALIYNDEVCHLERGHTYKVCLALGGKLTCGRFKVPS